jgi:ribosomal protein S27AE
MSPEKIWWKRSSCPKCYEDTLEVIESRPTQNGLVRRRKECKTCGHRLTTREISDDQYQQFMRDRALINKFRQWLGDGPKPEPLKVCDQCRHWSRDKCSMGFPEAGDTFADECAYFVLQ